jgi:hypothetical protein
MNKNISKALLGLTLGIALIGAGCQQASDTKNDSRFDKADVAPMAGYNNYQNDTYKFRIQYPEKWTKEEGAFSTIVSFKSPEDAGDTFVENVNIVTEDVSQVTDITPEKYEKAAVDLIKQSPQLKDFKQIESKSMTLAGQPGRALVYTAKYAVNNSGLYTRQYLTIKNKTVYIVTYTTSQEKPNAFMDEVQKMVNSFEIAK